MGDDYPEQEKAIEEIRRLSPEAKKFLKHHLCNSLNAVIGGLQTGNYTMAEDAAWHILADLELAGIREGKDEGAKSSMTATEDEINNFTKEL